MTELKRLALPGTVLTGLLGLDVLFRPIPFGFAYRAWLVALGGLTAAALVRASLAPYRRVLVEAVRFARPRPILPIRPAGLEEVERTVDFAVWNAADLNRRLRPLLREVAAHRLQTRRGLDLERNPEAARHLLGEDAWALLGLQPGPGSEGRQPAASESAIRETVKRLEEL